MGKDYFPHAILLTNHSERVNGIGKLWNLVPSLRSGLGNLKGRWKAALNL
jgi:hypothetical protein